MTKHLEIVDGIEPTLFVGNFALREVNAEGGSKNILYFPWRYFVNFAAKTFHIERDISYETDIVVQGGLASRTLSKKCDEAIVAGLVPLGYHPSFPQEICLFGEEEPIKQFRLFIKEKSSDRSPDNADRVMAFPGVTIDEIAFQEKQEASLVISIFLDPQEYQKMLKCLIHRGIGEAGLRVKADGFYSEWTPSYVTRKLKVLVDDKKYHLILNETKHNIPVPRLGPVFKFSFKYVSKSE